MDKRILYAGFAGLAAYFFWVSRSSKTVSSPTLKTSGAATSIAPAQTTLLVVQPDKTAINPAPVSIPDVVHPAASVSAQTITAESQFKTQDEFDEYRRRTSGLGW